MAIGQAGDLLTVAEAATVLKVSPITIHRWLKQGRLTAYRVGPRAVRISSSELTRPLLPIMRRRRVLCPRSVVPRTYPYPRQAKRRSTGG